MNKRLLDLNDKFINQQISTPSFRDACSRKLEEKVKDDLIFPNLYAKLIYYANYSVGTTQITCLPVDTQVAIEACDEIDGCELCYSLSWCEFGETSVDVDSAVKAFAGSIEKATAGTQKLKFVRCVLYSTHVTKKCVLVTFIPTSCY